MSKTIAIIAGVTTVAMLGGTFALTRLDGGPDCQGGIVPSDIIGGPFELISETGGVVRDTDVITQPALIYFGYTFCPDVCPLDTARNAAAVDILADQDISVTPIFISIDPARDTAQVVRDYTDNFHPDMIGLTGSDAQVAAVSRAFRTVYEKQGDDPEYYLMRHSTLTYLVLPDTGLATVFRQTLSPAQVAEQTACVLTQT